MTKIQTLRHPYLTYLNSSNVSEVWLNELQLYRIFLDTFFAFKSKLTWVVKNRITGWKDTSRGKVTNRLCPWRTWVSLTVLLEVEGRGGQEGWWRGGDEEMFQISEATRDEWWAHQNRSILYKTRFIPKHVTQICVKKVFPLKCIVLASYFFNSGQVLWSSEKHRLSAQTSFCHTSQTHSQQSAALSIQLTVMHLLRLQVWLLQRQTTKSPLVVWAQCAADIRTHLERIRFQQIQMRVRHPTEADMHVLKTCWNKSSRQTTGKTVTSNSNQQLVN